MSPEGQAAALAEVAANPQPGDVIQVGDDESTRREVTSRGRNPPWFFHRFWLGWKRPGAPDRVCNPQTWKRACKRPGTRVVHMAPRSVGEGASS